jgi:glycosyltransferase involved in cell wall biosynthesis
LIKVDVEGMEADVLEGAWRLLKRKRPVLYVEAQTPALYATLRRLLRPIGYQMVRRFNHTPTYVFVSCQTKKQIIDTLLEKTEPLASLEELTIVQRELSRSFPERQLALRVSLETAIAQAFEHQQEGLAAQLQATGDEQQKCLRAELDGVRREIVNITSRFREDVQRILCKNEQIIEALDALSTELRVGMLASSSAAAESCRLSNDVLRAIEELKTGGHLATSTANSRQATKPQSQSANNDGELNLRLPFEEAFLEVRLRSQGARPQDSTHYKSLSSRGIPEANRTASQLACSTAASLCDAGELTHEVNNKISVIMTTYDSASYVKNAVLNVLQQSHDDLELIVVDDASIDDTFEMLLELARTDPRVRPIKMFKNRGTYWCKNYGITRSTGRYIAFQDSDDTSVPERLELQLRMLQETNCVMCTCNYVRVDASGNVLLNRGREERKAIMAPLLDKQEVLRHIGYFDSVRTSADDEFNRRIGIVFGQERICHIDKPLYRATVREGSLTNDERTKSDISTSDDSRSDQAFLSAPRREYVRQYSAWHERLKNGNEPPQIDFPQLRRRFPAPATLLPKAQYEDCFVTASMASFPARRVMLEQTVASIIPQVDFLNVYLNGYDETPGFLRNAKIQVIHSREYGDLRDNGKFFFLDSVPWGYHFTIDDDIVYPHDYVQKMVLKIEQYNRKAIVGCHGVVFAAPFVEFMKGRQVFHFKCGLASDRLVNLLGTGTTAYHVGAISLSRIDFREPGMADLWLAVAAKRQKVPMIAIERAEAWLRPLAEADASSLYSQALNHSQLQTSIVRDEESWRLDELCHQYPLVQDLLSKFRTDVIQAAGLDITPLLQPIGAC